MIKSKPTHPILRATFSILLAGSIFFVAACEDETEILADEPQLTELSADEHMATGHAVKLDISTTKNGENESSILTQYSDESIRISSGQLIYTISRFKDEQTRHKVMNALNGLQPEVLQDKGRSLHNLLAKATEGQVLTSFGTENGTSENFSVSTPPPPPHPEDTSEEMRFDPDQVFEVVEDQPEPRGGMDAFYEFVGQRLRYPEEAQAAGIEGRVFIQFVVDRQGNVSEVKSVKGLGYGLDEAAEDMIRETKWEPGTQKGRPVKVRMIMPVMFKLSAD